MSKAQQTNNCYNCRGKSKRFEKRMRNRAQRRIPSHETPTRCIKGWSD